MSVVPAAPAKPNPLYRPRDSRSTALHGLLVNHLHELDVDSAINKSVNRYLACGDLHDGFARIRCEDCGNIKLLAFSCKQRCTCPSCHQKRTLLTAMHVSENVSSPVPHRQVVLTIPKRLRIYPRRDWSLMSAMASEASFAIFEAFEEFTGLIDSKPGIVLSIQTFGTLMNYHPHIHAIVTTGVFEPSGRFREVFRLPDGLLKQIWEERIFKLFVERGVITEGLVDQMKEWKHSGFSVDDSVYIPAGDRRKLEKLVQYIVRAPISLERILRVSKDGTVIYRSEKNDCLPYPDVRDSLLGPGAKRNFEVFTAAEFLRQFLQHIPPRYFSLIRFAGWYSSRSRGYRAKKEAIRYRRSYCQTWAMMITRVYQVDPLRCDRCGGSMRVVDFIEQDRTIARILRDLGLWEVYLPRPPPVAGPMFREDVKELIHVDFETFMAVFK